jgi:hypothetical protein
MFSAVRLLFAAAIAVTLQFTWTVGQGSGLAQVNKNLCELWSSLPLPAYGACEFQYALVISWGVVALAAAIWIAVEAFKAARKISSRRTRLLVHLALFAFFTIGICVSVYQLVSQYSNGPVPKQEAANLEQAKPSPPSGPKARDPDSIYQAGVIVGHVFGARRDPNDATRFTFVEITKSGQLNGAVPFQFQDYTIENRKG